MTVGFSSDSRDDVRPATAARYRQLLELHVIPQIGKLRLQTIVDEPDRIQNVYSHARKHGNARKKDPQLTGRTVLHLHRVLFSALKQARKWRLIGSNPCEAVNAPSAKRVEMRTLNATEARALIAASEGTRLHVPITLAVSLGLRRGEVCALKWANVDFSAGTIRVAGSLRPNGELVDPKTDRSRRTIAVPASVMDLLRSHRAQHAQRWLRSGASYKDQDFVFTRIDGLPWKPASIATLFRSTAKRAGLGHLRFHDLWHSAASLLIAAGVPITTVSHTLGHANSAITLSVYAHAVKGVEDVAARTMDGILKGVSGLR